MVDNTLSQGTVGNSPMGPLGLIYQQLKIITIHLQAISGISDEDESLLAQPSPVLIPPVTTSPTNL